MIDLVAQTVVISIAVDPAGEKKLVFSPNEIVTKRKRNEMIVWSSESGKAFALNFGWASPFEEMSYHAKPGKDIRLPIDIAAEPGKYKYFVAVFDDSDGQVVTADPDLIIRKGS